MSEQVKPGDRLERNHDMFTGYTVEVLALTNGGRDAEVRVVAPGKTKNSVGSRQAIGNVNNPNQWRRLPPADTGPQVGEVWRYRDDIPAPWTSFRGTERTVAQREGDLVTWVSGATEYVSFVVKHAERYIPAPQPAAPTGTPAKVECPECHGPGETVKLRRVWLYQDPHDMCDGCYMDMERTAAMETAKEAKPFVSPLPRDHWMPAIDALGGVRPFGRPRGRR